MAWWSFRPYVSVAQRRANAMKEVAKLAKAGRTICPVTLEGKKIATTFWGKAWCDNLESYSDLENRLPRGRTYVRNGSVVDLQIEAGRVSALVSGSELYKVKIDIRPLASNTWDCIRRDCSGQIGSVIELLQGKLSGGVMEIVTRQRSGLFPSPAEIEMDCSCPDWAGMCKHVAAVLYAVGARLDQQPEVLFRLRKVDHMDLIAKAEDLEALTRGKSEEATIAAGDLQEVFGIELEPAETPAPAKEPPGKRAKVKAAKGAKPVAKKGVLDVKKPAATRRGATRGKAKSREGRK